MGVALITPSKGHLSSGRHIPQYLFVKSFLAGGANLSQQTRFVSSEVSVVGDGSLRMRLTGVPVPVGVSLFMADSTPNCSERSSVLTATAVLCTEAANTPRSGAL